MFSNFRPPILPAASQTVTGCIVCRRDSEDTNEYSEADCTPFNMGLPGWSGKDFVLLRF
jgi:hypothetical protein